MSRHSEVVMRLADATADAYSFDRVRSWPELIRCLLRAYDGDWRAVESIVRSKWIRWACDSIGGRYGHASSRAVAAYVAERLRGRELAKLIAGSRPTALLDEEVKS